MRPVVGLADVEAVQTVRCVPYAAGCSDSGQHNYATVGLVVWPLSAEVGLFLFFGLAWAQLGASRRRALQAQGAPARPPPSDDGHRRASFARLAHVCRGRVGGKGQHDGCWCSWVLMGKFSHEEQDVAL